MIDVTITVPLTPIGKGRARSARMKSGVTLHFTPQKTVSWEASFRDLCAAHLPSTPIEGPVRVDILAVFPRPKSKNRKCDPEGLMAYTSKPDKDNVDKIVFDSLNRHLRDDAQIVTGTTIKAYCEKEGLPRTVVRVQELANDWSPRLSAAWLGLVP